MYGLILSSITFMITEEFGEEILEKVLERAKISHVSFSTHRWYSEALAPDMLEAACEETGVEREEMDRLAGRYFIRFNYRNGYGGLLLVLGRRFGDFLRGLDNLHEYLRFSFHCDSETELGLRLHYRSRRAGFVHFVTGALLVQPTHFNRHVPCIYSFKELASLIFHQDVEIALIKSVERGGFQFTELQLTYDNSAVGLDSEIVARSVTINNFNEHLPVDSWSFMSLFPFFIIFSQNMEVYAIGSALARIRTNLQGKRIDEEFKLVLPMIKFTWENCLDHLYNVFRLREKEEPDIEETRSLLELRGPLIYLHDQELMLFLPTVSATTMDELFDLGLFLNDLSEADCNRELILACVQVDELKEVLAREQNRSRELQSAARELAAARREGRELLRQLMPAEVARRLVKETGPISQNFEEVTVAFVKVVAFNRLTEGMAPMDIVNMLNHVYSAFDEVITAHGVYKVETIGESYMISCGVPTITPHHAEYIADTALELIERAFEFPSAPMGLQCLVKLGVYTGSVVGAIVGVIAPRYCLFGNVVNCASRMESHNPEPMTIQIGAPTKASLDAVAPGEFNFESRGEIVIKGKGSMTAFAVVGKSRPPLSLRLPLDVDDAVSEGGSLRTPDGGPFASWMSLVSTMSSTAAITNLTSRPASVMSSTGSGPRMRVEDVVGLARAAKEHSTTTPIIDVDMTPVLPPLQKANGVPNGIAHRRTLHRQQKTEEDERVSDEAAHIIKDQLEIHLQAMMKSDFKDSDILPPISAVTSDRQWTKPLTNEDIKTRICVIM